MSKRTRIDTSDTNWFDSDRYSGGKWGTKSRRKQLSEAIAAAAPGAWEAHDIRFTPCLTIRPVVKSRRPYIWPFRHRNPLMMYHFLSESEVSIVIVRAGSERYGIAQGGALYWGRSMHSAGSSGRSTVDLWLPLAKLQQSDLTNSMLQALLVALQEAA